MAVYCYEDGEVFAQDDELVEDELTLVIYYLLQEAFKNE